MSISMTSARRLAASAVGATAVAGAMLFGATPAANAAPAVPPPAAVGLHHVAPASWHPRPVRHGFGHGGYGRRGFWGHHRGFGHHRGHGYGHGGFGRHGWNPGRHRGW